jgi:hypothetical protein
LKIAKGAVIGLGVVAVVGVSIPGFAGGNKYASVSDSRDCDSGVVNWVGPIKLWPPNHKFVAETVTAVADDSTQQVTLTLAPTVTDTVGGDGGANHDPDYTPEDPAATGTGSASVDLGLRAERSGRGEGRTYTIDWVAQFGSDSCSSTDEGQSPFVVTVPHDMRPSNR